MRLRLPIALLGLCLLAPASAPAQKPKPFTVTSTANSIASKEAPTLLAGDLKGSLGAGAVIIRVASAQGNTAAVKVTFFTAQGTLKGATTFTFSAVGPVGPEGSTELKGTGTITSGTGAYKRARGTFTVSGVSPAGENYFQLKLTGSLTRS